MTRWEYMAVQVDWRSKHTEDIGSQRLDRFDGLEDVLNRLGAEGWEAVGIDASSAWRVLLKRALDGTDGDGRPSRPLT